MTIRDLNPCTQVRHPDDLVEFRKAGVSYFGICWQCRGKLHWDNWTSHREPIRTWCQLCEIHVPMVHLNLESVSQPETHTLRALRLADLPQ